MMDYKRRLRLDETMEMKAYILHETVFVTQIGPVLLSSILVIEERLKNCGVYDEKAGIPSCQG